MIHTEGEVVAAGRPDVVTVGPSVESATSLSRDPQRDHVEPAVLVAERDPLPVGRPLRRIPEALPPVVICSGLRSRPARLSRAPPRRSDRKCTPPSSRQATSGATSRGRPKSWSGCATGPFSTGAEKMSPRAPNSTRSPFGLSDADSIVCRTDARRASGETVVGDGNGYGRALAGFESKISRLAVQFVNDAAVPVALGQRTS